MISFRKMLLHEELKLKNISEKSSRYVCFVQIISDPTCWPSPPTWTNTTRTWLSGGRMWAGWSGTPWSRWSSLSELLLSAAQLLTGLTFAMINGQKENWEGRSNTGAVLLNCESSGPDRINIRTPGPAVTRGDAGRWAKHKLSGGRNDSSSHGMSETELDSLTGSWHFFRIPIYFQFFGSSSVPLASSFHTFLILQNQNWCQKYIHRSNLHWARLACYFFLTWLFFLFFIFIPGDNLSLEGGTQREEKLRWKSDLMTFCWVISEAEAHRGKWKKNQRLLQEAVEHFLISSLIYFTLIWKERIIFTLFNWELKFTNLFDLKSVSYLHW